VADREGFESRAAAAEAEKKLAAADLDRAKQQVRDGARVRVARQPEVPKIRVGGGVQRALQRNVEGFGWLRLVMLSCGVWVGGRGARGSAVSGHPTNFLHSRFPLSYYK
jgi:hypothetical protein